MKLKLHLSTFILLFLTGFVFSQAPVDNPCPAPYPAGAEWPIDGTCYNMNTNGMSALFNPGSCNSGNRDDAWAWFTGDGNTISVDYTPDSRDAILHVFDGTSGCGAVTEIGCADAAGNGGAENVTFSSTLGNLYLVRVQRWNSNNNMTGQLCVTSAGPSGGNPGDDCTTPIRIACGDPILVGETTIGNGDTEDDWSCTPAGWGSNATPAEDRFYVVQWPDAASGGSIRFDFTNVTDANDNYFEFYFLGNSCAPNTCTDHSQFDITTGTVNGSSLSYFDVSVPAGIQDYYFVVDGQNDGLDSYDLEVSCYATGIELDQSNTCGGTAGPCNYKLEMFDSWGDGWNGGYVDLYVNGSNLGPYSAAGFSTLQNIPVAVLNPVSLDYTAGSYETENTFILRDGRGVILHSETPSPTTGTLYTSTVSSASCGYDPVNQDAGVYCTWQEVDALGIPISSEYLAPPTQDPALGGRYKICENIYLQNPSGFEWVKDAVITVGDCWTNVTNITPNGTSNGFYDVAGDWIGSWNSGTREITFSFTNSRNATWGDGNNGSAGYRCNLYQFCYMAEIDPSCSPSEGFQNGLDVTDDGIGGGGGTTGAANVNLTTTSPTTNVLPVELVSFEAEVKQQAQKKVVALTWETQAEINNDYFSIERSVDGKEYKLLGKVKGVGNSNEMENYAFVDENPYSGLSYYRLTQTDFNKRSETFMPKAVNIEAESVIMLYPNPSNGIVNVEAVGIKSVVIRDGVSKVVQQFDGELKDKLKLNLDLKPGVYYITIDSESGLLQERLVIDAKTIR